MNQNRLMKERTAEIQAQLEKEKMWWEHKRAGIQSEFMKEIGVEEKPVEKAVEGRKNGSSDDDAVLVDAGGPAQAQGGAAKKKKGGKK
jgi:translocation protein SEC66